MCILTWWTKRTNVIVLAYQGLVKWTAKKQRLTNIKKEKQASETISCYIYIWRKMYMVWPGLPSRFCRVINLFENFLQRDYEFLLAMPPFWIMFRNLVSCLYAWQEEVALIFSSLSWRSVFEQLELHKEACWTQIVIFWLQPDQQLFDNCIVVWVIFERHEFAAGIELSSKWRCPYLSF